MNRIPTLLVFTFFFIATNSSNSNPLIEYGIPFYPKSSDPIVKPNDLIESASEITYETEASPQDVFDFYLRSLPDTNWNLKGLQDTSIEQFQNTVISLSLLKDDNNSAVQLVIFHEGPGPTSVLVTYIPDLKALAGAQRKEPPPPSKPLPDEEPEDTDLSEFFPLNKPLAEIKRLINERNFEELYKSSSSYFKKHTNVGYLERAFSKFKVRKLTSTYRRANKELSTAIISFELQKENGRELGHRIMYFNYEDEEWKFNNLPFLSPSSILPSALRQKFE